MSKFDVGRNEIWCTLDDKGFRSDCLEMFGSTKCLL